VNISLLSNLFSCQTVIEKVATRVGCCHQSAVTDRCAS